MSEASALIKEALESSFTFLPCEGTAKRQLSNNQDASIQQTPNRLLSWL